MNHPAAPRMYAYFFSSFRRGIPSAWVVVLIVAEPDMATDYFLNLADREIRSFDLASHIEKVPNGY